MNKYTNAVLNSVELSSNDSKNIIKLEEAVVKISEVIRNTKIDQANKGNAVVAEEKKAALSLAEDIIRNKTPFRYFSTTAQRWVNTTVDQTDPVTLVETGRTISLRPREGTTVIQESQPLVVEAAVKVTPKEKTFEEGESFKRDQLAQAEEIRLNYTEFDYFDVKYQNWVCVDLGPNDPYELIARGVRIRKHYNGDSTPKRVVEPVKLVEEKKQENIPAPSKAWVDETIKPVKEKSEPVQAVFDLEEKESETVPFDRFTFPKGIVWIKSSNAKRYMVHAVLQGCVQSLTYKVTYRNLYNTYTHSADNGKTWLPCKVAKTNK